MGSAPLWSRPRIWAARWSGSSWSHAGPPWPAPISITHKKHGAPGSGAVTTGDARHAHTLVTDPHLAGRVALLLTSPPYGDSTHGQVRTIRDSGEPGVHKSDFSYGNTRGNLVRGGHKRLLAGFTDIMVSCLPLLRPGAIEAITTRPSRRRGQLVDFPAKSGPRPRTPDWNRGNACSHCSAASSTSGWSPRRLSSPPTKPVTPVPLGCPCRSPLTRTSWFYGNHRRGTQCSRAETRRPRIRVARPPWACVAAGAGRGRALMRPMSKFFDGFTVRIFRRQRATAHLRPNGVDLTVTGWSSANRGRPGWQASVRGTGASHRFLPGHEPGRAGLGWSAQSAQAGRPYLPPSMGERDA